MKTKLNEEEVALLQERIINDHIFHDCEQFGHLEYLCQYTVDGVRYLFHKKTLMDVEVYKLEGNNG